MIRNRRLAAMTLLIVLLIPAPSFAVAGNAGGVAELLDRPQYAASVQAEPSEEPAQPPPFHAAELPFHNARATVVTPTRIDVEWDAPGPLWVLVEVWREGDKINGVNATGGKTSVIVAPEMSVTVVVSSEGYSESVECEIPAGKHYRDYGYQRAETYTACVTDVEKRFYDQPRKSVKAISREELIGNLGDGYAYGTHISFRWNKTKGDKRLSDLALVAKAPDGGVFVEESAPMTIPGRLEGVCFAVQINNALRHFISRQDFSAGEYTFLLYTEGRFLGDSRLTIGP